MGAWWANDPWVWWESLAVLAALVSALIAIFIIARLGRDERA